MTQTEIIEKLQIELSFCKQVAFKLQTDVETAKWETANRDLSFLKEMKCHAEKAFDHRDIASEEMLFTMINDWIDELTEKL